MDRERPGHFDKRLQPAIVVTSTRLFVAGEESPWLPNPLGVRKKKHNG
jgi:hypothetical protein